MSNRRATRSHPRAPGRRASSEHVRAGRHLGKRAPASHLVVRMVAARIPYAEVCIQEAVTEDTLERLFEHVRLQLLRHHPRHVLVDMSEVQVVLSISDLNELAKLIAANFGGEVERLAVVLRPADAPVEKFFEPAMSNRGMPTYVSLDRNDAIDWLTAALQRPR